MSAVTDVIDGESVKSMAGKINVGVLGCTGAVGQRFVELLEHHPYFVLTVLGASERSVGRVYSEIVRWRQSTPIPASVSAMKVVACVASEFIGKCEVVFSGLDASVAGPIEEEFAAANLAVFSNAKNHRMDNDVPIVIPEVNADHIDMIVSQRRQRKYDRGCIVTNANCSTTGLVVALKPLLDAYGIEKMIVFTMQAISGAGYPGVPSLDIVDNVIPYISGEEPKMEIEPKKIFGTIGEDGRFQYYDMDISAHCNRVAVIDGHTECVSIKLRRPASLAQVVETIQNYQTRFAYGELPSSPTQPIVYMAEDDRPQPRLDRLRGGGYSVCVGRVRPCNIFDYKLTLLSHNTILGAAGGSILNAELARSRGYI